MRVAVLGAGVVGVVTAYWLARKGHDVTVMEQADRVASGSTYANGGQLAYSFTDALARPALLRKLPGVLLGRDPAIRLRAVPSVALFRWSAAFLRECTNRRANDNTIAVLKLALRSAALLDELLNEVPLEFSFARAGKLALLSRREDLESARQTILLKETCGCVTELLSPDAAGRVEPALADLAANYVGAIYSRNDHVADARAFTEGLANWLGQEGSVTFRMSEAVSRLIVSNGRACAVRTERDDYPADAIIVCLGTGSEPLLRPLGIDAGIFPVRGYSVTLPVGENPPRISISDLQHKIVFSRLDGGIRIAGFADFLGLDTGRDRLRLGTLVGVARRIAPRAADYDVTDRQEWGGFRPMTPDSRPRVGPTSVRGLYLNTGHGMLGWTLACATAHDVAEAV